MQLSFVARDWYSGQITGRLPFSRFTFNETLNRAGAWTGEMDPYDPRAALLIPHRTYVYALRDDNSIAFAGMLGALSWSAQGDAGVDTLNASGYSLWGYFTRRLLAAGHNWTQQEQMSMAKTLLDEAQGIYGYPFGSIGVDTIMHPAAGSGVLRDRAWYQSDGKTVSETIEQLADCLNGFEFRIVAAWSSAPPGGHAVIQHTCELWYPRIGIDQPFIWRDGTAIRVTDYTDDFSGYASQCTAFGAVSGNGSVPIYYTGYNDVVEEPLYENTVNATDVTEYVTLADKAQQGVNTSELYLITVQLVDEENFPYGTWQVGDTVRIVADRGSLQLHGDVYWRIVGMTIDVDDIGTITTGIDLTDSGRRSRPVSRPMHRLIQQRKVDRNAIAALQRHP